MGSESNNIQSNQGDSKSKQSSTSPRPAWKKKRFLFPAAVIAIVIIASAASHGGHQTTATSSAGGSASTTTSTSQTSSSDASSTSATDSSSSSTNAVDTSSSNSGSDSNAYKVGQTFEDGSLQITVNSVKMTKTVGDVADGLGDTANGIFYVVNVTVKNNGTSPTTIDDSMFTLQANGSTYDADTNADVDDNTDANNDMFLNEPFAESRALVRQGFFEHKEGLHPNLRERKWYP
ncbi:DUF4352 domain-containing protein, partial [Alicyclobacillus mali (ex Roth et al. 2021)]|uniref:DUF4352 domain-containing protein n=1 Tax=Alicyclobacillus mali (ex Roth et al. 2021) TaxID=1123961 RepID=UPI001A8ED4C4